jgi:hypothetical protein
MTITRSVPTTAAAALCAATLALGLSACGSQPTQARSTRTAPASTAPALTQVDAPTAPRELPREPRCFPGKRCAQ